MSSLALLSTLSANWCWLVEMQFVSATVRRCSWGHNLTFGSTEWIGLGGGISVSGVDVSENIEYPALDVTLSIANPADLSLALGQESEYRNRPVLVGIGVLDEQLRPQSDPLFPLWTGDMDAVRVRTGSGEGEPGTVALRCEVPGRDGRHATSLRMNNAQHQARWPGDTGMSRIESLIGAQVPWLSRRFQESFG
jgi:hypothetical protein